MAESNFKYQDLINTLTALTQRDALKWQKDNLSNHAFVCFSGTQKFLIDQYYSSVNGEVVACLNLAIFEDRNSLKIFDEINVCPTLRGDELESFKSLKVLYGIVETKYNQDISNSKKPTLTSITESLQKQLRAI